MSSAAPSAELLPEFVDEAMSSLQGLPAHLDEYLRDPSAIESMHAVFRAVHSIKGNAGFFGFTAIKSFAHALENVLDEVRKQDVRLTKELERAIVRCLDHLEELLQATLSGSLEDDLTDEARLMLERLEQAAGASRCTPSENGWIDELLQLADEMRAATDVRPQAWADQLTRLAGQHDGQDEGESGATDSSAVPTVAQVATAAATAQPPELAAHACALLELFERFGSHADPPALAREFVTRAGDAADWAESAGLASLSVALRRAAHDLQIILNSPLELDGMLIEAVWEGVAGGLASALAAKLPDVASAAVDAIPDATTPAAESATGKSRILRVREDRLDEFLQHVSSLFITGELLKDLQSRLAEEKEMLALAEELAQLNRTFAHQSTELQKSVSALQKVPLSGLFGKFPRMARNLAAQLGKEVDVVLEGENLELDKSLVDDLDAPLTHMIRNVVDHAIETPDLRKARGVDPRGHLWLRAELTKTHARVTVEDDGRGIDPARIRAKALERGLLDPAAAAALSDADAIDLVFAPGLSTAEKITEVSGRGVGMDVVRTTIREHNGDVRVESTLGRGTKFTLQIPLRRAVLVLDALMMRHAGQDFVLPFEHILEIAEIGRDELRSVQKARLAAVRGKYYDAVSLGDLFQLPSSASVERLSAVLIGGNFGTLCLLVDQIAGHRQVVVNSLPALLPPSDKLSGVAPLGGGRLALVLSAPDIVKSLRPARR